MPRLFGDGKPRRKRSRRSTRNPPRTTEAVDAPAEPQTLAAAVGAPGAPDASATGDAIVAPKRKKRARRAPRPDAAPRVKGLKKKKAETEQLNEQGESGKPGRPALVFDDDMVETITALVGAEGFSKDEVAMYFGVSRDAIYDRCNPESDVYDPRISDAFARGFVIARAEVGLGCFKEAKAGSLGHIQHWQERFGVYRGQPRRMELTGKDGGPMETRDVPLTNEEIAARLQGLIDRQESTIANAGPTESAAA